MTTALASAAGTVWPAPAHLRVGASAALANDAFGYETVVNAAREIAEATHRVSAMPLRPPFDGLSYDMYRAIRMPRDVDPLADGQHAFGMDMLSPGSVYRDRVSISIVGDDGPQELPFLISAFSFDPSHFDLSNTPLPQADFSDLSYTGFRLRQAINRPDMLDEFVVFQGASYFRAIGRGMLYGLSARGLALNTADPRGEEYPIFTHFWIMTPAPQAREIVVYALLQSPSCTGAYAFEIAPGDSTVMQIRCTLFPRVPLEQIGIAPLTSMYFFGPAGPADVNDFRSAVHDSDGLQMIRGDGGRLWRPLTNPHHVEVSAFQDEDPQGFGLVQRRREFAYYQDDEARYDLRPSAWVEPLSPWGRGAIVLVEIPVVNEFNDNIVCFWRPETPIEPRPEGHEFSYRLHWGAAAPDHAPLARVMATRVGQSIHAEDRFVFVVDFGPDQAVAAEPIEPQIWASSGTVMGMAVRRLPETGFVRLSFEFEPSDTGIVEMQSYLAASEERISETWLFRWSPQ